MPIAPFTPPPVSGAGRSPAGCSEAEGSPSHIKWDFAAPVAGAAFTLSFSPFDYSYLIFPALAFLIAATVNLGARRAFLRGYLFGLGVFGLGVSWVFVSLHDFGGVSVWVAGLLTCIFVAFWALFPALSAGLAAMLPVWRDSARLWLYPFVWILVEYFRGTVVLDGFPWLQTAYSQLDTPLAGYVPVLGSYGTGFAAIMTAAVLVMLVNDGRRAAGPMAGIALMWGCGFYLTTVSWTHPVGSPFKATLIQGNISQDKKWLPENRLNTLLLYRSLTERHWDSAVIVWPETSIPAYLDEVADFFIEPLNAEAGRRGTDLIVSVPVRDPAKGEKYNAVVTLGSNGGIYRKIHLLPFGEYLPWQPVSGFILEKLKLRLGNFTPGSIRQPLLSAGGFKFGVSICYEDVFGELAAAGTPEAAYLVNVTNDGWFGNSIEPYQHLQLARMRALETGRYLLRATNTGLTAIVAPDGSIQARAPLFTVTTLTGEIMPMGGKTPFADVGDAHVIFLLFAVLAFVLALSLLQLKPARY